MRVVIGAEGAEDRRSKGYKSEESGCTVGSTGGCVSVKQSSVPKSDEG